MPQCFQLLAWGGNSSRSAYEATLEGGNGRSYEEVVVGVGQTQEFARSSRGKVGKSQGSNVRDMGGSGRGHLDYVLATSVTPLFLLV